MVVKRATTIVEDDESSMVIDSLGARIQASPADSEIDNAAYQYPAAFTLTAKLYSRMCFKNGPLAKLLSFCPLNQPLRDVTILLIFLIILTKQPALLAVIDKLIPREELATFFMTAPSAVIHSQGLVSRSKKKRRFASTYYIQIKTLNFRFSESWTETVSI